MRKAQVFYKNELAGIISETDDGFEFKYNQQYLDNMSSKPISLTLPLQSESFKSKVLFAFFDGLIPEGWLLNIAVTNWKLKPNDRFGMLITLCTDCIGFVSIIALNENL